VVNPSESFKDAQYTYDAFVSYSTQDEQWVRSELLQCLERNNLKVCIDFRDFRPGYTNIDEINRAVQESRKMLLVITPSYLRSQWTTHERQIVQNLDPMNRQVRLIPLLKEPCELPTEINHLIYVDLTRSNSAIGWNRLLQAFDHTESNASSILAVTPTREGINPFIYGNPVPPEKFYGRRQERLEVKNRIGTGQSINVVGLRRIGKSSLLRYIQARPEEFFALGTQPLIVLLDLTDDRFHSPDGMVEGLRRGIRQRLGKEPWQKESNGDAWVVQDGLEELRDRQIPLIIMLDEFESIASRLEQFQGWGEDWRSKASTQGLFTLVIASKRPVGEIYQELHLTSPFGNIFSATVLGALAAEDWRGLVRQGLGMEPSQETWAWLEDWTGGLPYYVQLAGAMVWQYEDLAVVEREFEFQAMPRLQELWQGLSEGERVALRSGSVGAFGEMLRRYGVVRSDRRPFSRALERLMEKQR